MLVVLPVRQRVKKMPAGNYQINLLLANVCKQNITRMPYEIARLAEDIAGGLMVTMPSEQDLRSEKDRSLCREIFAGSNRDFYRKPDAYPAPDRKYYLGYGSCWISDRIYAWEQVHLRHSVL